MKKLVLISILAGLAVMPVSAVPIIEFSPGGIAPGSWFYDGAGTITFDQIIDVDRGLGNSGDTLAGAWVHIPDLAVTGIPGGPYVLTPVTNIISITDSNGAVTYLSGTLGSGDLVPVGTTAVGYTSFGIDITNITINNPIGSDALAAIAGMTDPTLDFELSLNGAPLQGFKWMLDNYKTGNDGFSGAMTPEPATLLLLGLGTLSMLKRRKQ